MTLLYKYNAETFIYNLKDKIKEKINLLITEINNHYNDGVNLETIKSEAWFDSANKEAFNFDPFVYYGISDFQPASIGPVASYNMECFFEICFVDQYQDTESQRRMLRYQQALMEAVSQNYKKISYASQLEITQMIPVQVNENEAFYKIGGVYIKTQIA